MKYPIYMDYAATTPCDPRVLNEMSPYFLEHFGNPNSLHAYGTAALEALDTARGKVSELINANFEEIVFTSGATESNRIVIERPIQRLMKQGKNHFITTKTEHKSVFEMADCVIALGGEVTFLDVLHDGVIDLSHLAACIKGSTSLCSICFVNNETGVFQDIKSIAKICHERDVLIHTDATQAFGKIPIDIKDLDVDFLSASGHKIYGPKGIGMLFAKRQIQRLLRVPDANREVEFGIRSGTVPVPLCVGMGKASEIASHEMAEDLARISRLRKMLVEGISSRLDEIYINGSDSGYPGIVNVSFRGCEGEALMMEASRLAVSSGSACTSNKLSISHVLKAMNIPTDIAQASIRISIGRPTTEQDINVAIESLVTATQKLRKMSPIWDMIKAGVNLDAFFGSKEHEI